MFGLQGIVAGLAIPDTLPSSGLLVGVGAGSLAMFLREAFPKLHLLAIELDLGTFLQFCWFSRSLRVLW